MLFRHLGEFERCTWRSTEKKYRWKFSCSPESKRGRSKRAVACGLKLQSVFLFTPHYLLAVYPANERQYKVVGGDSDISTQAGSLETFELLARMAAWNGRTGGSGCRRETGGDVGWIFRGLARVVGWKQTKSTTSNENSAILIHSSSFQTSYKGTAPHTIPTAPHFAAHLPQPSSFTFLL